MSTTKTTTNQYNPQSMQNYTQAQSTLMNTYQNMVANPYSGANYQMGLQQNQNASNTLNATNMSNAMNNLNMSGMGNLTGGAQASLLSGLSRQATATNQQGFFNNWNTATANQQFGAGVLGSMQPLQTGQQQSTSGLGTWLPQLAAAAAGAATGGLTSGLSGGFMNSLLQSGQGPAGLQSNNTWANGLQTQGANFTGGLVNPYSQVSQPAATINGPVGSNTSGSNRGV